MNEVQQTLLLSIYHEDTEAARWSRPSDAVVKLRYKQPGTGKTGLSRQQGSSEDCEIILKSSS
jgi:hypothetical protein